MLSFKPAYAITLLVACSSVSAEPAKSFDAATAFGARPSVSAMSLSPDGKSVAYVVPANGQGSMLITRKLGEGSFKRALYADGKPFHLTGCGWVSAERLVCAAHGINKGAATELLPFSRIVAVNADGSNQLELNTRTNEYSRGYNLFGGSIVDWLPDEDGSVLMARSYLPDDHPGTHLASQAEGLGVDKIDTRTLAIKHVEPANPR